MKVQSSGEQSDSARTHRKFLHSRSATQASSLGWNVIESTPMPASTFSRTPSSNGPLFSSAKPLAESWLTASSGDRLKPPGDAFDEPDAVAAEGGFAEEFGVAGPQLSNRRLSDFG